MENLALNVERNIPAQRREAVSVLVSHSLPGVDVSPILSPAVRFYQGYVWGSSTTPLLSALGNVNAGGQGRTPCFDLIIMSDLVFNHSQVRVESFR